MRRRRSFISGTGLASTIFQMTSFLNFGRSPGGRGGGEAVTTGPFGEGEFSGLEIDELGPGDDWAATLGDVPPGGGLRSVAKTSGNGSSQRRAKRSPFRSVLLEKG